MLPRATERMTTKLTDAELETVKITGRVFQRNVCPNAEKRLAFPSNESMSVDVRGGLISLGRPFAPPVAPTRGSRQCGAQIGWAPSQRRVDSHVHQTF